eukprot:477298_1
MANNVYALWKCGSCGLLNYNMKSSQCKSCFKSARVDIKIDEELRLWYEFLDQCLLSFLQYIPPHQNEITSINLIIAFPFYQKQIYSSLLSHIVNKISLQNLSDYKIDFSSTTYGYYNFNKTYSFRVNNDNEYNNVITKKKCLIDINHWENNDKNFMSSILKQLNNDMNQKSVMIATDTRYETHSFFKIDGLNYEYVFEIEPSFDSDMKRLKRLLIVALFKDNKQPIDQFESFGMNSIVHYKEEGCKRLLSAIIVIKNKNYGNAFVYRAVCEKGITNVDYKSDLVLKTISNMQ